jgi:hypothetical protein
MNGTFTCIELAHRPLFIALDSRIATCRIAICTQPSLQIRNALGRKWREDGNLCALRFKLEILSFFYSAMSHGDQLAAQLEQQKEPSLAPEEALKAFQDRIR